MYAQIDRKFICIPCGPKVYDRVCSLNQLINWFFMLYSFISIYTDNSFFAIMFLKLIGKKLQCFEFCVSGYFW